MKNLIEKLLLVQKELKVPKSQFNKFGNYYYRSCEDIFEAAKPICSQNNLFLKIEDEIENIGNRYYVKAIATITDGMNSITTTAYAREEETKKGMDSSQITGSTSSYARKYALNGLFCLDDVKDSDSTNKHDDGTIKCPICSGEMWDNSKDKINPKALDFKCKNKDCKGVIWHKSKNELEEIEIEEIKKETEFNFEENEVTEKKELKLPEMFFCQSCGQKITKKVMDFSKDKYGDSFCYDCQKQIASK